MSPQRGRLAGRLATRLVLLLSLALLPLGAISLYLISQVVAEAQRLSHTALLDRTQQAAARQRELIRGAFGAADALGAAYLQFGDDPAACDAVMADLIRRSSAYTFAGITGLDGAMNCTSTGRDIRFGPEDRFRRLIENPARSVRASASGIVASAPVLIVTAPIRRAGTLEGFVSISIPHRTAELMLDSPGKRADLIVFNASGEVLSSTAQGRDPGVLLPRHRALGALTVATRTAFSARTATGARRDFAVVPIVEGAVFAIGSWQRDQDSTLGLASGTALALPVVMWAVSILVVYVGLHRLVLRHVRRLQRRMRLFSTGHPEFTELYLDDAPEELDDVAETFRDMARRVQEHDRRRASDLHEKTVLLKEVHHRVKNNLQLISSMMNMQIRGTDSEEARGLLRRVQDRISGLATIHRHLYTARNLAVVEAGDLLEELVNQLVAAADPPAGAARVAVTTRFAAVGITPDQSVPLSLLLTEAVTNAIKYAGAPAGTTPWITVSLVALEDGTICLSIVNSRLAAPAATAAEGGGLGSRLIQSFAVQLDGTVEIAEEETRFAVHVTFPLQPSDPGMPEDAEPGDA